MNPFKSANQRAQKNTLTGYVEPAHINEFHFNREIRSFDTLGYARNPTAEAGLTSNLLFNFFTEKSTLLFFTDRTISRSFETYPFYF